MTAHYTLYHNPRCSKSRQTLALLEQHNITPTIVEYLHDTPDEQMLRNILDHLDMEPRALMRKSEAPFKELDLANTNKSDDQLIAAMCEHPILIERPVVVKTEHEGRVRAVLGRPPENVLALLQTT